jgi:hypothetical protein
MYDCKIDQLITVLRRYLPNRADYIGAQYQDVEFGLLPVGLKIHCLQEVPELNKFFEEIWSTYNKPAHINQYKKENASICYVLPPVGSATIAISLLECLQEAINVKIFGNSAFQIQVCSPGRLIPKFAALMTIGKCLSSDQLKWYNLADLETNFSNFIFRKYNETLHLGWGRRLTLYDAGGYLETNFDWWNIEYGSVVVHNNIPLLKGRTDVLDASTHEDIRNVNLLATLFLHAQLGGFWSGLGNELAIEITNTLIHHQLDWVLGVPWVVHNPTAKLTADNYDDENRYQLALQELMAYAVSETKRFKRARTTDTGILSEMKVLMIKYREAVKQKAQHFDQQRSRT